jgi:hypothetical protein
MIVRVTVVERVFKETRVQCLSVGSGSSPPPPPSHTKKRQNGHHLASFLSSLVSFLICICDRLAARRAVGKPIWSMRLLT